MTTIQIERDFSRALSTLPRGRNAIREIVDDLGVPSQDRGPESTNNFRCQILAAITDIIFEKGTNRADKDEVDLHQLQATFQLEAEIAEDPERRAIFISIACAIETVMGDAN